MIALPAISLAIWYPYVGKLGALIAAFSTMFVIYVLPLATYTKAVYVEQYCDTSSQSDDDSYGIAPSSERALANKQFDINTVAHLAEKDNSMLGFKKVRLDSYASEQLLNRD